MSNHSLLALSAIAALTAALGFAAGSWLGRPVPTPAPPAAGVKAPRVEPPSSAPAFSSAPPPALSAPPAPPARSVASALSAPVTPSVSRVVSPVAPLLAPARVGAAPAAARPVASQAAVMPMRSVLSGFRILGAGPAGGLRLGRVTPGSLPDLLGLQTGDELLTVNGFRIADPEQALQAYARLRTADRWQLAIARQGQRTEIQYFIR